MLLKIDTELKNLIRPLTFDERNGLKENLIKNGCLDSIKTWNDVIVDGHNRYEICTENGIAFRTDPLSFDDRNDVKIWMIRQQLDKRNINDYIRTSLVLKMKSIFQEKAGANLKAGGQSRELLKQPLTNLSNPVPKLIEPVNTRAEIAKNAHVSEGTVAKVEFIEQNATEEQKEALINDKTSIHKVYTDIKKQVAPDEEIEEKEEQVDTDYCMVTPFYPKTDDLTMCPCGCNWGFCIYNDTWYNPEETQKIIKSEGE